MKVWSFLPVMIYTMIWLYPTQHIYSRSGDLRSTLAQAEEEDKLAFVDLTAKWCHSCKLTEEATFRDLQVVKLVNDHFLALKVDTDQIGGKLLAAQKNVSTLPASMVLDGGGTRLAIIEHAPRHQELLDMLKSQITPAKRQHP